MSAFAVISESPKRSGAMYLAVPTVVPNCVSFSSDVALAMPKSTR